MRRRSLLAILLAVLLTVPVVGGSNSAMQAEEEEMGPCMEEPEQPCENQTVMHLWSNGNSRHWSHFNVNETDNAADNQLSQEKTQGVISIDERFTMNPQLTKKLNMTLDGEIRIVLNIYLEGDWSNNDINGPCTNYFEELNVTLWSGATSIITKHVPQVSTGWNTVTITHRVTEEQTLWDSSTANPALQIEMKVKGDRQQGVIPGTVTGDIANFTLRLSGDGQTRVELPIDPSSWEEGFQSDEAPPMAEEQPGFLFMAAVATMTLAAVYLPSREENSENGRNRS
ncbi:MAG: hypothetical protein QF445_03125 [Candidatus Poseidoniaceae archaeon]|nr:hypothetical protein [Candidatus Poseidoniaceae archaeon]